MGATLAVALLSAGCSTGKQADSKPPGAGKTPGEVKVGAVMFARDLEFWQLVEAGMKAAAQKNGVELNVEVSNRQLQTESQLVDTMRARGDNVLLIAPLDATASTATLQKARRAGMTVVQYNGRIKDDSFKEFVGVDQIQLASSLGEAAQNYIASKLGGKAKVALLTGDTDPNGITRKKAFLSKLSGADIVTTAESVGSPEAGSKAFETVLQSHPDIDVVWAWNGAAMQGAAVAAKRMKSKVKIFGIDMSKQVVDIMATPNSPVVAVADQHAYDVGYSAVQVAVKVAHGKSVAAADATVKPLVYEASDPASLQAFRDELSKATP